MKGITRIINCSALCLLFVLINVFFTSLSHSEVLSVQDSVNSNRFGERVRNIFQPSRSCYSVQVTDKNRKALWLTALTDPELLSSRNKRTLQRGIFPVAVSGSLAAAVSDLKSVENKELSAENRSTIKKDLGRTALQSRMYYQRLSPESTTKRLEELLEAISKYDDIGYCQGMNFVGAFLLDNMSFNEAFFGFKLMMQNPILDLKSMYQDVLSVQLQEMHVVLHLIKKFVPRSKNFIRGLSSDEAGIQMTPFVGPFMKLFVGELPFETVAAIWDCLFLYGRKVLYAVFIVFSKDNQKVFTTSQMPFQEIYEAIKRFAPQDTDNFARKMRKFTRRITDSTVRRLKRSAPKV